MRKRIVFWDVDTQYDFMMPDGRLYVPGAEKIIKTVTDVRKFGLETGCSIIADVDWHSPDNDEISDKPDFKQTFPPHCMAGEPGSERVGYLGDLAIEYVQIYPMERDDLQKLIDKKQFHVVLRKESIDVFDNPNTNTLIELVKPDTVVVFGVALDFCVYYVLRGLAKHVGIKLVLLEDAVKSLQTRPDSEVFAEMRQMGVKIIESSDLSRFL